MTKLDLHPTGRQAGAQDTECSPAARAIVQLAPFSARYRIEAPLGHGTTSIFRAKDLKTGSRHAIKRLPQDAALEPGEYERFVSEVTLLSQLCPPNIVAMKELHRDDAGRCCLVMELLEGEDALTHLAGGQRLSLLRVLEITRQVASALHCAHLYGIAHREFKLSSIFLASKGGPGGTSMEVVTVVGFGGVRLRMLPGQRGQDCRQGTAEYLAPEAITGPWSELDASSDQWSAAVAVYRMLSGRQPFQADDEASLRNQICHLPPAPLKELCPELPQHVVATLERALSKDKAQRFASMAEFMRALSGQLPLRVTGPGQAVELAPAATQPLGAPAACARVPHSKPHEQENSSRKRRPISVSEVPTISIGVNLERTQNIDPQILDQLRAQSSAEPALNPHQPKLAGPADLETVLPQPTTARPETLPGAWLMARHRRGTLRQTLVLALGSCLGLSLGISAAWLLGLRQTSHSQHKALPIVAPSGRLPQPAIAAATSQPHYPRMASIDLEMPSYLGHCYGDGSKTTFVSSALSHLCLNFPHLQRPHNTPRWARP